VKPAVAFIIANHNYGEWLIDAVNSAINQYYEEKIGIFVVDCASTDDSWNKLGTLANTKLPVENKVIGGKFSLAPNRELCLIRIPENHGPSYARNLAIHNALAEYDYFSILDADDMAYPDKTDKMLKIFQKHPLIGVVYGDYDIFNVDTGLTTTEYKEPYDQFRLTRECIVHSGSMISKAALVKTAQDNQFYDNAMRTCEDYDLWIRISKQFMIYHEPSVLSFVRNHKKNSTNTVPKSVWESNWARIAQKNG